MRPEFHELDAQAREAWDPQDRTDRPLSHPVFGAPLACRACCNTPADECICAGWSQADEVELRRRISDRGQDWTTRP